MTDKTAAADGLEVVVATVIESHPLNPRGDTAKAAILHDKSLSSGTRLVTLASAQAAVKIAEGKGSFEIF